MTSWSCAALLTLAVTLSGCCSFGDCQTPNSNAASQTDGLDAVPTQEATETKGDAPSATVRRRPKQPPVQAYSWEWLSREKAKERAEQARMAKLLAICKDCSQTPGNHRTPTGAARTGDVTSE